MRGLYTDNIVGKVDSNANDVAQGIQILEPYGLIEHEYSGGNKTGRYRITTLGIDEYEKLLPPSVVTKRVEQRS
jgi:hypothetical protein